MLATVMKFVAFFWAFGLGNRCRARPTEPGRHGMYAQKNAPPTRPSQVNGSFTVHPSLNIHPALPKYFQQFQVPVQRQGCYGWTGHDRFTSRFAPRSLKSSLRSALRASLRSSHRRGIAKLSAHGSQGRMDGRVELTRQGILIP